MSICKGKILFSILLASVIMCLQFSMQEEDIIKHINGKCHVCFKMQEEVIIEHLRRLFSQLVEHCVTHACTL